MNRYKNKKDRKKESLFSKIINISLTIFIASVISSQMCTAANNNLRFVHVSDSHFSTFEENTSYKFLKKSSDLLDDVIFQINTSGPYDFVMFTGDLVNKPKISELESFINHANNILYPWYAIDGNHDIAIDGPLTKKRFSSILNDNNKHMDFDNIYYAYTPKRGFRVIALDSIIDSRLTSNGEIPPEEMNWLKCELENHKKDVIILSTHVPIYEPYSSPNHRLLNDKELRHLLKTVPNTVIVLQGHYHCARIIQDSNVVYISTPSLVIYPNSFRVINVNSNNKRVLIDIFLKETNLKDIQNRSKMRVLGSESLIGTEKDGNLTIEIIKNKE